MIRSELLGKISVSICFFCGKSEVVEMILREIVKSTFGTEKNGMNLRRNKTNFYGGGWKNKSSQGRGIFMQILLWVSFDERV